MTRKEITKLFVRFLITFAFSLVILIPLGLLLENKMSDFVMVVMFVVIAGGIFALEEYLHFKAYQKRQRLKEEALRQEELSTKPKKEKQVLKEQKNKKGAKDSGK